MVVESILKIVAIISELIHTFQSKISAVISIRVT